MSKGMSRSILPILLLLLWGVAQAAPERILFRLGAGSVEGTYFPIASLIAGAVSGLSGCPPHQSCGVAGLLMVAQVSNGSVANLRDLRDGQLEAGLVQADLAQEAFDGRGAFAGSAPYRQLRVVASLYAEEVHIVVPAAGGIGTIPDLARRRVSLSEPGSGTLAVARRVLQAHALDEQSLQPLYLKPQHAVQGMLAGTLDGFFLVAGRPVIAIDRLAHRQPVRLLPIEGSAAQALQADYPYLFETLIPAGTYPGVAATPTLAVGALLAVDARADESLIYAITRALWSDITRQVLDQGHPKGRDIRLEGALEGVALPLHPGAARFYREQGLLFPNATHES